MLKKLITLFLTIALVFCTWTPAFAADQSNSTSRNNLVTAAADSHTSATDSSQKAEAEKKETEETQAETENNTTDKDAADSETDQEGSDFDDPDADKADREDNDHKDDEEKKESTDKKTTQSQTKKTSKYQKGLASYIRSVNPSLSKSWSLTLAGYFISAGKKYNLDPTVLMAIAQRESTFRASAKSPYGYKGIMQTSDLLARTYGYKPSSLFNAKVSIDVGARYLSTIKKKFKTYTKALSGYIYGPGAVSKGKYSAVHANKLLKTSREIKAYLKKHGYVS